MVTVLRWSSGRTERLLEERDADALGTAYLLQSCRRPRLALHHLGKERQPDGDDFAFLSQTGHGLIQELLLILAQVAAVFGKFAEGPSERRQHFSGVVQVEEICQRAVLPFDKSDFQIPQKSANGEPEIIPHHDDALYPGAVALPQGLYEFGVFLFFLCVEPLLEL